MIIKDKIKKSRTPASNSRARSKIITTRPSMAGLFGVNKKEVDGLTFQKKVRNEWQ